MNCLFYWDVWGYFEMLIGQRKGKDMTDCSHLRVFKLPMKQFIENYVLEGDAAIVLSMSRLLWIEWKIVSIRRQNVAKIAYKGSRRNSSCHRLPTSATKLPIRHQRLFRNRRRYRQGRHPEVMVLLFRSVLAIICGGAISPWSGTILQYFARYGPRNINCVYF